MPKSRKELDSEMRVEKDPVRREQRMLRLAQEIHGAPAEYKARQDALMRPDIFA